MKNEMKPVHPGEILSDELEELSMSATALAHALAVPTNRVTAILKGQRGITADTALRLSRYFGTSPATLAQPPESLRVATGRDRVGPRNSGARTT